MVTCDVKGLGPQAGTYGALLTVKGKVVSDLLSQTAVAMTCCCWFVRLWPSMSSSRWTATSSSMTRC